MTAKKISSDRRRSRPITKRRKTDVIKKNRFAQLLVILVVIILVIGGIYSILLSRDDTVTDGDEENPIAVLDTSEGEIRIELFADKVPTTAGNFVDLSKNGFYDGTKFHRIAPGFMIQGGCPNSKDDDPSDDGYGGPGYTIPDEFHPDLENVRGMISMANSGPNTGGSQFFILVDDSPSLNNLHAVFGEVVSGMDIVDKIANMDHDSRYEPSPGGGRPLTDVVINSITIID